jgi:hypothetical protein
LRGELYFYVDYLMDRHEAFSSEDEVDAVTGFLYSVIKLVVKYI